MLDSGAGTVTPIALPSGSSLFPWAGRQIQVRTSRPSHPGTVLPSTTKTCLSYISFPRHSAFTDYFFSFTEVFLPRKIVMYLKCTMWMIPCTYALWKNFHQQAKKPIPYLTYLPFGGRGLKTQFYRLSRFQLQSMEISTMVSMCTFGPQTLLIVQRKACTPLLASLFSLHPPAPDNHYSTVSVSLPFFFF